MQMTHNRIVLDVNATRNQTAIVAKAEDSRSRILDVVLTCSGKKEPTPAIRERNVIFQYPLPKI